MNTLNANYDRQKYAWREYNETGEVPYEWTNKRGKLDKTRMSFLKGIVGFQQIVGILVRFYDSIWLTVHIRVRCWTSAVD
jgi:hypothetical protein